MKQILKIFIPVVLILALVLGCVWFFFQHRPDLTAAVFISRAERAMDRGRYDRAVRYYTYAWRLSPDDDALAIDLAQAHKSSGNYTKAEYTLVSAITRNPDDVELYLALARAYVEQDKLLDAVQMLDYTANESIKEQLNALRPAAPVLTPDSGYYNERIEISASWDTGACYWTADGSYPSLERPYDGPITLEPGVTTVYALAVTDDGLVSPLATAGYTISGVVEEVSIQDPGLDACIRSVLGKSAADTIMSNELWSITELELTEEIGDLSELSKLRSLTSLTAHYVYDLDLTVLGQLPALTALDLSGSTISSASVRAIASCTELTRLNLQACSIADISPLSSLTKLEQLDLGGNVLTDISPLAACTGLKELSLNTNQITNITPLASCTELEVLDLADCQIIDISPLAGAAQLKTLILANNQVTDISALESCSQLVSVDVSYNQLTNIDALTQLTALTSLQANYNQVAEVADLVPESSLQQVNLAHNLLTGVGFLADLEQLNYVDVDYNEIETLSPLADCPNLVQVNAFGNPITDVSELKERDIIVTYDPTYTAE